MTVGAGLGSLWSHVWGHGLSQDPQTQESCLWPLLGAHGAAVGLPVPPRSLPRPGPRGGSRGRHGGGWHSVTATLRGCRGLLHPGQAHAPDLTTAQMIRMFWGGLSFSATPGSCTSSSGSIPRSPSGRFRNADLQSPGPTGTAALLSVGFFGEGTRVTIPLFPAWPKPEAQLALTPLSSPTPLWGHPGLSPLPLPAGHIQSHHPDAIAVLTLAPESIKHSGKVQSSSWAWQGPEGPEEV